MLLLCRGPHWPLWHDFVEEAFDAAAAASRASPAFGPIGASLERLAIDDYEEELIDDKTKFEKNGHMVFGFRRTRAVAHIAGCLTAAASRVSLASRASLEGPAINDFVEDTQDAGAVSRASRAFGASGTSLKRPATDDYEEELVDAAVAAVSRASLASLASLEWPAINDFVAAGAVSRASRAFGASGASLKRPATDDYEEELVDAAVAAVSRASLASLAPLEWPAINDFAVSRASRAGEASGASLKQPAIVDYKEEDRKSVV